MYVFITYRYFWHFNTELCALKNYFSPFNFLFCCFHEFIQILFQKFEELSIKHQSRAKLWKSTHENKIYSYVTNLFMKKCFEANTIQLALKFMLHNFHSIQSLYSCKIFHLANKVRKTLMFEHKSFCSYISRRKIYTKTYSMHVRSKIFKWWIPDN